MTKTQSKALETLSNRLLSWPLPDNFNPDGGITFEPIGNKGTPHEYKRHPVGTNLFDATQARGLIEYLLEDVDAWVEVIPDDVIAPSDEPLSAEDHARIDAAWEAYRVVVPRDTPTQAEAERALSILKLGRDVGSKQVALLQAFISSHPEKPETPPVSDITEIFDTTGIEGFGASYWRHDDAWHFYSMPGTKGLSLTLKGGDHSKIEYIIELMRKGLEYSQSPDKPAQPDLTVAGERQQEGWKLVPISPTEEMVEDGEAEIPNNISGSVEAFDAAKCVYRAMLAAAPVPTVKDNLTVEAPGHTDLMVPPETIDAFMVANPLPYAWVIPGDDNAKDNGYLDAMAWREGEFTKPLYDRQPAPVPPSPGEGEAGELEWYDDFELRFNGHSIGYIFQSERGYRYGFMGKDLSTAWAKQQEAQSALEAVARAWLSPIPVNTSETALPDRTHQMVHGIKTWPVPFQAMRDGLKPFEYRKHDRDYQVGDTVVSDEWDPATQGHTGRRDRYLITFLLPGGQFGIPNGYCIFTTTPKAAALSPLTDTIAVSRRLLRRALTENRQHQKHLRKVASPLSQGYDEYLALLVETERDISAALQTGENGV